MNNIIMRVAQGGALVLGGLVLGWAARGLITYDTGMQSVTDFQDWHAACPAATAKDAVCEMVENVVDSKTGGEVARITITKDAGKDVFGITMPFGVALEPGVGIIFGTDPVKVYPYRTCNTVGCLVMVPMDDKLKAQLNAGKDGRVLFAGLDNKPVALPISLKGYAQAARSYRRNDAKRSFLVLENVVMKSFSFVSRAVKGLTFAAFALSAVAGPVAAQTEAPAAAAPVQPGPPTVIKESGDWVARCFAVATASPCDMFQELADRATQQRVLGISIAYIPSSDRYAIQLSVPLGVALTKGATITAGSFSSPVLKFRRCDRGGCYVETLLDNTIPDKLAASGNEGVVKITANDGKAFPIKFSLNGFTGAREAMMDAARQRAKAPAAAPAPAK